jgi:hypothetical protein
MVECKICKAFFEDDKSLHHHLKAHKLHVFEYYQTTSPRYDLYDKNLILFKNKKQYFETDFNSAKNMRLWLDQQLPEKRIDYLKNILLKRRDEKSLIYTLSQIELRSLKIPGLKYYNKVFENYYTFCESLGFKNKYSFPKKVAIKNIFEDSAAKIYIDTREQLPLEFDCPSEVKTLKFGDYAFSLSEKAGRCYVERKSLNDFIGTLSGGFERFENEIIRAKEAGAYLVILIEDDLNNALRFNTLEHLYKKGMKVTPEYIFHNVRQLIQKYDHIQFLFVKNRQEASQMIKKLFSNQNQVKKMDLQFHYDMGVL